MSIIEFFSLSQKYFWGYFWALANFGQFMMNYWSKIQKTLFQALDVKL